MWKFNEMAGDHITPWSKGGKTERDNLQMLWKHHNSMKSNN
ncbi:HNH endonuclease [Limosilactobacillus fermentum]